MKYRPKGDVLEKKTAAQIIREEEIREKRLKRQNEMELWYKKRERENIELKKEKAKEDKMKLMEKIKEDRIYQKQRVKEVREEFYLQNKEKYEKLKKQLEEGEIKSSLEREKIKMLLEKMRKADRDNLKRLLEENELNDLEYIKQQRKKLMSPQNKNKHKRNFNDSFMGDSSFYNSVSNFNIDEKKKHNESQIIRKNTTSLNIFNTKKNMSSRTNNKNNNSIKKSRSFKKTNKKKNKKDIEKSEEKEKDNENEKENEIKDNLEEMQKKEEEEKIINEQIQLKNKLKEKYLNSNCNIYRCLYCHKIPIININEFNHQIETYCNCKNNPKNKNIVSYDYFEEKSLNHPIDNNICCLYCNKNINELNNENTYLNICEVCNEIICSKDEMNHKNQKHPNNKELKEKYKNLLLNKNNNNKKENTKNKNSKTKNRDNKNKLSTPKKGQNITKKNVNSSKKENNIKDKKISSNKKSNEKKKNIESDKNSESNKKSEENNNNNKEEENLNKVKEEKLPLYLIDSCCIDHGQVYDSYCHDCFKNICSICIKNEHQNHNIENLDSIMIDEEQLLNLKQSLEKNRNDLNNINNYFNKLIEKIKEQFAYFYSLKQKEIEIKQKIINNYETIKYNYNTIQNIHNINNININNNNNSIIAKLENTNKNNDINSDILSELKLIFNYLNESTQITNVLNSYKNKNKYLISKGKEEINEIIKTDINDIALAFFNGCFYIYDVISFDQKICCKVFDSNKGINHITQLKNGDFACAGYEKIKIVNINLDNKKYYINNEIKMENGSFNIVKELRNNYLITYDTNNKLKIWYNYKIIYEYNNTNINSLLPLKDNLFITSSINDKKIDLYNINIDKNKFNEISCSTLDNISVIINSLIKLNNNYIVALFSNDIENNNCIKLNSFSLDNISVIKQKNPIIKLNNNYIVALVSYEEEKLDKNDTTEKFEESKNNEENYDNGICLIEINKNQLKIIHNIKNKIENGKYIHIINYINNSFLVLNDLCDIELCNFDKINTKITILNKFKVLDNIYNNGINNVLFVEENGEIILQCCNNLVCLSHK